MVRTPARTATEALVLVDGHGPLPPGREPVRRRTPSRWGRRPSTRASSTTSTSPSTPCRPRRAGPVDDRCHGAAARGRGCGWAAASSSSGRVLAAVPGQRRRPTDPVSAPVPAVADGRRRQHRRRATPAATAADGVRPDGAATVVAGRSADDDHVPEPVAGRLAVTVTARRRRPTPDAAGAPSPAHGPLGGRRSSWWSGPPWWRCSPPGRRRPPPRSTPRSSASRRRRSRRRRWRAGRSIWRRCRGRWVVVNFFASWCPPCQQEQPELVAFAYQHRGPGDAALVGVVFDDAPRRRAAFMRSTGATWPAVVDPGGQIALRLRRARPARDLPRLASGHGGGALRRAHDQRRVSTTGWPARRGGRIVSAAPACAGSRPGRRGSCWRWSWRSPSASARRRADRRPPPRNGPTPSTPLRASARAATASRWPTPRPRRPRPSARSSWPACGRGRASSRSSLPGEPVRAEHPAAAAAPGSRRGCGWCRRWRWPAASAGLGRFFWRRRRRRRTVPVSSRGPRPGRPGPGRARAPTSAGRPSRCTPRDPAPSSRTSATFLLRSLEDLEREHGGRRPVRRGLRRPARPVHAARRRGAAGLGRRRAPGIRRRCRPRRAQRPARSRDGATPEHAATRPRRRRRPGWRWWARSWWWRRWHSPVVTSQTGARLPGQTATGSVSLSRSAQLQRTLAQAETLQSSGDGAEALGLYRQVLAQDPTQPDALAEAGWLEYQAGAQSADAAVLGEAQDTEEAAVRAAPGAYAPRLYLGSMFLAENDAADAVVQYRQFLADGPPAAELGVAKPFIVEAFGKAHEPVPALPGSGGSTATTSSVPARRRAEGRRSGPQGAQLLHHARERDREGVDVVVGGGPPHRQPQRPLGVDAHGLEHRRGGEGLRRARRARVGGDAALVEAEEDGLGLDPADGHDTRGAGPGRRGRRATSTPSTAVAAADDGVGPAPGDASPRGSSAPGSVERLRPRRRSRRCRGRSRGRRAGPVPARPRRGRARRAGRAERPAPRSPAGRPACGR